MRLREDLRQVYRDLRNSLETGQAVFPGRSRRAAPGHLRVEPRRPAPLFDALAERRADSEVRIRVLTFADPFGPLRAGELDAMLPWLPIREPDLTVGPVVFTEPIVMAMSTTDPLAQQDSVSLEAFADRTAIVGAAPDYWRHTPASPTRSSATHHSPVSRLSGAPPPKPISSEPLPASSPSRAR